MSARAVAKQILGTVVAVFAGWLAAILFVELFTAIDVLMGDPNVAPAAFFVAPLVYAYAMSYFILPVWLFLLVPLYLFVPPSSVLWHWPLCTAFGVASGVLIVAVFLGLPGPQVAREIWLPYVLAALVGGVTCLTGAIMRERFRAAP